MNRPVARDRRTGFGAAAERHANIEDQGVGRETRDSDLVGGIRLEVSETGLRRTRIKRRLRCRSIRGSVGLRDDCRGRIAGCNQLVEARERFRGSRRRSFRKWIGRGDDDGGLPVNQAGDKASNPKEGDPDDSGEEERQAAVSHGSAAQDRPAVKFRGGDRERDTVRLGSKGSLRRRSISWSCMARLREWVDGSARDGAVGRGRPGVRLDRVRALAQGVGDPLDREIGVVAEDDRGAHLDRKAPNRREELDPVDGLARDVARFARFRRDDETDHAAARSPDAQGTVRGDAQEPASEGGVVANGAARSKAVRSVSIVTSSASARSRRIR